MRILCAALLLVPLVSGPAQVELFRDDFSHFPPGLLSQPVGQLNGAIQDYHYLPHRGVPTESWANAIVHDDSWLVGDEQGKTHLEQHARTDWPAHYNPIMITGDPEWADTAVQVKVRPLSSDRFCGVVFRYHRNRHYYLFAPQDGKRAGPAAARQQPGRQQMCSTASIHRDPADTVLRATDSMAIAATPARNRGRCLPSCRGCRDASSG